MHYKCLLVAHKAFYWAEPRAHFYDEYMQDKLWEKWTDSVPLDEVKKLFDFIIHWDYHFQGDPKKFQKIYGEISATLKYLKNFKLEDANFDDDKLTEKIEEVFDKIATGCSPRYESTDTSKILHTIIPDLFVMWDRKIRKGILGDENRNWGAVYAIEFLPKMQEELREAIEICMKEKKLDKQKAIRYIVGLCDNKTLPKLIDEYNYMIFRRLPDFKEYFERLKQKVEELRERDKISEANYEELLNELLFVKKLCLKKAN